MRVRAYLGIIIGIGLSGTAAGRLLHTPPTSGSSPLFARLETRARTGGALLGESSLHWTGLKQGEGIAFDGLDSQGEQRVRVVFDAASEELRILSRTSGGADEPDRPVGDLESLAGLWVQQATGSAMAWQQEPRSQSVGSQHRSWWRSGHRKAMVTIDKETGALLYLRVVPIRQNSGGEGGGTSAR